MSIQIQRTRIIGTDYYVYSAWEPDANLEHGTLNYGEFGSRYGRIGTTSPTVDKRLPALDYCKAVRQHYAADNIRAYREIVKAYPHLADQPTATLESGSITVLEVEPADVDLEAIPACDW